jgi:hypothetical protein
MNVAIATLLCEAIRSQRLVRFYYDDPAPGLRVVEPHTVAYNRRENLALKRVVSRRTERIARRAGMA